MRRVLVNNTQLAHAAAIVAAVYARVRTDPHRAAVITIETALVESELQVFANSNVPESMHLPHEAVGSDHLSVGIFQQQTPMWGTAPDCMDPVRSAHKFLDRLMSFDWASMPTGQAAQHVQGSAFPDRYQTREAEATQIVNAVKRQTDWFDMATKAELKSVIDAVVVEHLVSVRADLTKTITDQIEAARHNLAAQIQAETAKVIAAVKP